LLNDYHQLLSVLRDSAASQQSYRPVRDLKTLRSLVQTQFYDVAISAQEIGEFVESDRAYRYDTLEMQYVRVVGGKRPDLLQDFMTFQASRARLLQRDSVLLQSTISLSGDITQTISNARIQRLIVFLSVISLGIAVAAILISLSTTP
jgi:hypothetical protein